MATPENRPPLKRHEVLFDDIKSELKKPGAESMILAFLDSLELRDAEAKQKRRFYDEGYIAGEGLAWGETKRVQKAELTIDTHTKEDLVNYTYSQTIISPLVGRYIGTYRGVSLSKDNPTQEEQAIDKLKALREEFRNEKVTEGQGGQRIQGT
jgi:hypothetical protein